MVGNHSPAEYLLFGAGNRRCLGYALAMLEMKLVIATVVSRYNLNLTSDRSVKAQRRGLTIAPDNGISMVLSRIRD